MKINKWAVGLVVLIVVVGGFILLNNNKSAAPAQASAPTLPKYPVTLTAYNAVPEQTDSDPYTTASGAYSDPDVVAARSADLADELPFGTVIAVSPASTTPTCGLNVVGDMIGFRVIADSMHSRKRNQIDILFEAKPIGWKSNPAVTLGVCKNIQVQVVGHIDIAHMPHSQTELKAALAKAPLAVNK